MMMTFVLTPRSHYNTITEPCAHFLFSLLEGLSMDFPSHVIVSMIDIYQDTTTCDKLIFPSAITCILTHMHVPIPFAPLFSTMGVICRESMQRSAAQLVAKAKRPHVESTPTQWEETNIQAVEDAAYTSRPSSSSAPSSSFGVEASLTAILDQLQQMCADLVVVSTLSLMRCVRLTLELVVLLADSHILVALLLLPYPIFLRRLLIVEILRVVMLVALLVMIR